MMDGMLEAAREAERRKEAAKIPDYPPDVQEALTWFWELWKTPIPSKPRNGRGQYAQWTNDLRELARLSGSYRRAAFERAYESWRASPFTVAHPGAIAKTVAAAVGEINQEVARDVARQWQPEPEPPGGYTKPNPEDRARAMARIEEIARQKREEWERGNPAA